ncbi:MAG: GtrA family protein [Sphingopyxis sp.]|uniref:GtrA family protein n=1 Tax=Sphingopyxis sp. TaxID=1908224 RepID=UPI002ABC1D3A|nr:GtrA family protein [Sphingopyxis sp.]MDZ3833307.1 GtrA family protein [Sphingopyxis sp.]
MAGALNTALGLSFYPLLLWWQPYFVTHYLLALAIAQAVCLCFAFATHKLWVFRTRGALFREFAAFASFYLFNYAANWAALPLLVEWGRISPVLAQLGFTLTLIVGSWYWHSRVTFRSSAPSGHLRPRI